MRQASGLYACTASVDGATVAVVDDVLTTGSTLHGISLQLKAAGAVAVWGLVLARTPYR
jgi:predicted amidophosphoribosyltransferase